MKNPAIILLAAGQTLVWAGAYYIFPALLLRWEQSTDWSRPQITLALMLATFSMAATSPLTGRLIDKGMGPLVMGVSTVGAGLCIGMLSLVPSLLWFYLVWIVNGAMLAGCLYEPCFALITRVLGIDTKKSITAVTLVAGFASTLSFPAAHFLSDHYSWQLATQVFAAIVIVAGAPLLWLGAKQIESQHPHRQLTRQQPPDNTTGTRGSNKGFLQQTTFWLLAAGFAILALVHGTTLHHLLPLLNERGMAAGVAIAAVSLIGPMQVSGRIVIAVLGDRISNHTTVLAVFASMGASILCLFGAKWQPWLLFLFVPLFGGGYGILSIIRPVVARELLGGESFGAKSGVLAFVYLVGSGSAPWIGSLVWRIGGYQLVLPLLVIVVAIAVFFYVKSRECSIAGQ